MTDAERELHIQSCGELMQIAMQRFYETHDDAYRAEARTWLDLMEEAIMARSAEQVTHMEAQRGLANA